LLGLLTQFFKSSLAGFSGREGFGHGGLCLGLGLLLLLL
jgi:hypothetical protein